MKLNLFILACFLTVSTSAQKQLQITYQNLDSETGSYKSSRIELMATPAYCFSNTLTDIECTYYGDDMPYIVTHEKIIYKDYKENALYYEEKIDHIFVCEELKQFNWQVINETDSLLGYQCTKAKTEYRGRAYTAWFTTELPFRAAPWKFHGLPGVVLKIDSKDEKVKMEAIRLKITEGEKKENPYKKEKCIGYDRFVEIYLVKRKEFREWVKATSARTGKFGVALDPFRIEKIEDKDAISLEQAVEMWEKSNK